MNNISKSIATLIHYNVLVRDTLEYTLNKKEYSAQLFNYKKNGLKIELEQETPLKIFIDKNGENGQKLKDKILEMYERIYGDKSTIIHIAPEGLRVDSAQALTILDLVIPLHEELFKIINAHLDFARKENQLEDEIVNLVKADDKFYRGIVFMSLVPELERLFVDYNKARSEAKGEITPQSNFIQNDLNKVVGLFGFSRQNARVTDREYIDLLDKVYDVIEEIEGRRDLRSGHTFQNDFAELKQEVSKYIAKNEPIWKEQYDKVMNELVSEAKAMQEATGKKEENKA
jgi:hypothetical protein